MIREHLCDQFYWDKWVNYKIQRITEMRQECALPSENPEYEPQYAFKLAQEHLHLLFRCYSRGDAIGDLVQYFPPLLDAWGESNRLHLQFRSEEELRERSAWATNLDHYIVCFWLVGLALSLEIPDDQWQRLLVLIGNEGNDVLLDRIIATRQPGRKTGDKLCHPKPYQRLLAAIDAPPTEQAGKLLDFVKHWFKELDRPARKGVPKMCARPYWYTYGDQNIEGGAYFGRWCVEAVAAVKAFSLDDNLCLGHEHYPGDLLRPDGPTTHLVRPDTLAPSAPPSASKSEAKGWLAKLFGKQ